MEALFKNNKQKNLCVFLTTLFILIFDYLFIRFQIIPSDYYFIVILGMIFASFGLFIFKLNSYSRIAFGYGLMWLFPFPFIPYMYHITSEGLWSLPLTMLGIIGVFIFASGLWDIVPPKQKTPVLLKHINKFFNIAAISIFLLFVTLIFFWGPIILISLPLVLALIVVGYLIKKKLISLFSFGMLLQFSLWIGIGGFYETPQNIAQNSIFFILGFIGYMIVFYCIWQIAAIDWAQFKEKRQSKRKKPSPPISEMRPL